MKTPFLCLIVGAATLIPAPGEASEKVPYDEIVKTYDQNGDGKLDEREKAVAKEAMAARTPKGAARPALTERRGVAPAGKRHEIREKMLEEFDRNGDGRLDEPERAAFVSASRAKAEGNRKVMRRFDKNRDGKLSDSEWAAVRTRLGETLKKRSN